jgi:hypothetical protein
VGQSLYASNSLMDTMARIEARANDLVVKMAEIGPFKVS